jgi:hypothetical protein
MLKRIAVALSLTLLVSSGAGLAFHLQSPEGLLLYTPAPDVPARYTPSFLVGFWLASAVFLGIAAIAGIFSVLVSRVTVAKLASSVAAGALVQMVGALLWEML